MKKSELKRLVEQKVNEAWYNNLDDFYHGVGKCATIGGLGTMATLGGAYALDKGMENQEKYQQHLNQQAAHNAQYTDNAYTKWCDQYNLNPDDDNSLNQYNDYLEDQESEMNEARRYNNFIASVMQKVKKKICENKY